MENDTLTAKSLFGSIPPIKGYDIDHVLIQPKHESIELPKEVGEELDKFKKTNGDLITFVSRAGNCYSDLTNTNHFAVGDYTTTEQDNESIGKLVDAWRYGWKAEPESKWYVQTPKEWWEDKSKPEYVDLDSMGISEGHRIKKYVAQFTRDELKKYRLDNDIFTLVPVGKLK